MPRTIGKVKSLASGVTRLVSPMKNSRTPMSNPAVAIEDGGSSRASAMAATALKAWTAIGILK